MGNVTQLREKPKVLPQNIEVEQALLGAILVNNDAYLRVQDFLSPDHFFERLHAKIFELAATLIRLGKIANPITLKMFLPADLSVSGLTASQYLARLAAEATTVINAEDYGRTIYDLAVRRSLISVSSQIADAAYEAPADISARDQLEAAEEALFNISEFEQDHGGFAKFGFGLAKSIEMSANAYQKDGKLSGLATGLFDLDRLMGGLQRSDLIILAGRPGMGKTALATNVAYHVAANWEGKIGSGGAMETTSGGIVGFFSVEMSEEQLATRIISEQTEIPSYRMRRGDITIDDFERMTTAVRRMETIPLYIDQAGGITIGQIAARARRLRRQRGLDLLVVDYIQLVQGSKRRNDGRVQEVTEITTGLKALAKELNIPILALSQLSRQVENREDKRPQLADLRESGSIEQDADVVMFVFREEYYLKNREPRMGTEEHFKWMAEMDACHGRAEVILGKQRHGPTGTVQLQFNANVTRFSNLADPGRLPEGFWGGGGGGGGYFGARNNVARERVKSWPRLPQNRGQRGAGAGVGAAFGVSWLDGLGGGLD